MNLEYNREEEGSGSESMLKAMQDQGATYREEDLATNLDWIEASGKVYQMNNNGEKFAGDHRALAKYGIDQMSEFNYNVAMGMIPDVLAVEKADPVTQMSFAYLMDTYDKKDITLDGFGRAVKELALDPTTYLGISTLGAGFAVKKGAQQLAKEGLKNRLHNSIRNYLTSGLAIGATEGAIYSAGDTTAREMIQTDAGLREGVSGTDVAISGVIGAGVGAGLGKGIEAAGKAIGKGIDYLNKEGEQAMAQVAGGGVPPSEYRGYHKAPRIEGANTGDNLKDIFPDDIYTPKGVQYYGTGDKAMDTKSISIIQSMRNKPDKEITVYRAVPKGVKDFNDGDWITINPDYAKWHGESWVEDGKFDIISKKVKAKYISTNGDSIHEWGYNEKEAK